MVVCLESLNTNMASRNTTFEVAAIFDCKELQVFALVILGLFYFPPNASLGHIRVF